MKTLKVKSIFFNLLAMMAIAIFMTSCEQQSMIIEETSETEILEKQSIVYVYGNTTYEVSKNEDGSLNRYEISEELQQLIDTKHVVKLGESNTLHLFDSQDATKDFIMDVTGSTKLVKMESFKNSSPVSIRYYKGTNLQGPAKTQFFDLYGFNLPKLGTKFDSFDNQISSCRIDNPAKYPAIIVFYDYQAYWGLTFTIYTPPVTFNAVHPNFQDYGFNNRASSMKGYHGVFE